MSVPHSVATNGSQPVLPGAQLWLFSQWLPVDEADRLLNLLNTSIQWENHRLRLFGREVDSPRLSSWIGDPETAYTYSGARFQPQPWPAALEDIRQRLVREFDVPFNSVLANRYRDGRDCMGWHSDNESALGNQPVIASLSLGAARRFALKHRHEKDRKLALELPHGSLLVMAGDTQTHYRHTLPRTARPVGERINLTFRRIFA